jgi:hypothetical protein
MTTTNINNYVETSDMALAAILLNKGYELSHIKPTHNTRYIYCFVDKGGIHDTISAYDGGDLLVEPKYLWYTITTLHSDYHGEGSYED